MKTMNMEMLYYHGITPIHTQEYDCSNKTEAEWARTGVRRPVLGYFLFNSGVLCLIVSTLVLIAMSDKRLLKISCYKLMYTNLLFDIVGIVVAGPVTGHLTIEGAVFCTHPYLTWAGGTTGLNGWCASCVNCIILAFNRLTVMTRVGYGLFEGTRIVLWLFPPLLVGFFMQFCTRPLLYNTAVASWLYAPMIVPMEEEMLHYTNVPHAIINILTPSFIFSIYFTLCFYLIRKRNAIGDISTEMEKGRQRLFVQVSLICLSNGFAACVYIYLQYFPVPLWFNYAAGVGYLWGCFAPCAVYLLMNKDVQTRISKFISRPTRTVISLSSRNRTSTTY